MKAKIAYKSSVENYQELLAEARKMSITDIQLALRQRAAFHVWAVRAYEQALKEKEEPKVKSVLGKCKNCGRESGQPENIVNYAIDPKGQIYGAFVFALNKIKGCAHEDDIKKLYYEFLNLTNLFSREMHKLARKQADICQKCGQTHDGELCPSQY